MKFGIPISFLLHAGVIFSGLFVFGGSPKPLLDGRVIPVELITIGESTNIRAAIKSDTPTPSEAPMELIAPQDNAPEAGDDPKIALKDAPLEPQKAESVPARPNPDAAPTQTPKPAKPAFDLDKLAALIDRSDTQAAKANQQNTLQSDKDVINSEDVNRAGSGAGTDLTLNEFDALQSAMYKCWRIPLDAKNPEELIVKVNVKLFPDGYVSQAKLANPAEIARSSNPFLRVAADRALQAVSKCAPYDFLPPAKFSTWKDMTLTFRPVL